MMKTCLPVSLAALVTASPAFALNAANAPVTLNGISAFTINANSLLRSRFNVDCDPSFSSLRFSF